MTEKTNSKRYIQSFFKDNQLAFVSSVVLTIVGVPANLIGTWILGKVIDIIMSQSMTGLMDILIFSGIFISSMFIITTTMYWAKSTFIHKGLRQYKSTAFKNLSQKSISAFTRENTGSYISLLTNDVNSIEENYLKHSYSLIYYILLFIGTIAMMLWYSPLLTVITIILSFLPMGASMMMSKEMVVREKTVSDKNERFVSLIQDLLTGFSTIKSFKAEDEAVELFSESNKDLEESKRARYWWSCLVASVSQDLFSSILQFGVFIIGAYFAIKGEITPGTVLIFLNLCNFIIMPIRVVPQYLASRKGAKGLIDKLAQLTEQNQDTEGENISPVLNTGIQFENVDFGYVPDDLVLQNMNMNIEAGKRYAIVGASGSGKSTIINLLMGSWKTYTGSIKIDDNELKDINPDSLYDLMSMIDQNVFLFDDTIYNNITMFKDFPEEEIDRAIKRSGLTSLIAEKGIDYMCGEGGVGLSGGEKQRISIARTLLQNTSVMLIDEATAALDSKTAKEVVEEILNLEEITRIVVTHSLNKSLLRQYDEIFVLRKGEIIESGTFDELMNLEDYFYSLYNISN